MFDAITNANCSVYYVVTYMDVDCVAAPRLSTKSSSAQLIATAGIGYTGEEKQKISQQETVTPECLCKENCDGTAIPNCSPD